MPEAGAQERTEEATPRKRQQARKKGTVARSMDLTSSLAMLVGLLLMPSALNDLQMGAETSIKAGLGTLPTSASLGEIGRQFSLCITPNLKGLGILMASLTFVGIGVSVAQVGFVLSGEALTPQFNRLNPIEGFKRLFSRNAWFEAVKALLKSGLIALLAYSAIMGAWPRLMAVGYVPLQSGIIVASQAVRGMAFKIVAVWLALAGLDYFFQRKRIDRELRMSKQEIKEEMKEHDQNPEVKMAQARRRRQLARKSLMQAIRDADVVITNPTHYAVAIEYDADKSTVPIIVAKGADALAAKIRELAAANDVPIIPNPPLTRALYHQCDIGDVVPKELFQPVAEILAYVYKTLHRVRKGKPAA